MAGSSARAETGAGLAGAGRLGGVGTHAAAGTEEGEAEPAGAAIEGREEEKLGRLRTKLERDAWAARAQVELQLIPG